MSAPSSRARRLAPLAATGLLLAAAGAAATAQDGGEGAAPSPVEPAATPADAFTLAMDWPAAGHVRMTVAVEREDVAGSYACTVSWAPEELPDDAPDDARPGTIVRFSDFDVLELNGKKKGEPGFLVTANVLAPVLAAVPPFRVDADGEFVGLLDLGSSFDEFAPDYEGLAPGALATIRTMLDDPLKRRLLQDSAAQDWAWWGSFWNGYESAPGEAVSSSVTLPSGLTGKPIEGVLTMECVDRHERDGEAAVHMRARTEYDPADMLRVTLAALRLTSGQPVPDDAVVAVSRVDQVDGVYALDGVLPLEVRWRKAFTIDDGSGPDERVESKSWTFVWPE